MKCNTTAGATTSTATATVLAADSGYNLRELIVINEGTTGGFGSLDGGTNWFRITPGATGVASTISIRLHQNGKGQTLKDGFLIKRESSDMSGVWAIAV